MDAPTLLQEINRFDPQRPIAEAWTPPASWYQDPQIYELERQQVFGRTWQPVARAAELVNSGDYVSGCLAGEPWVVVRSEDGTLRAFHNVCRHKGREVVIGSGNTDSLVCGYHAWKYRLDGSLQSAPRVAGIKNFDRDTMSLPPLGVEAWGPWVFINGDTEAPTLHSQVGELDRRLAATQWQRLRFYTSQAWEIQCNWKVYADNYLDGGYHISSMHPSLNAQLDMASYRTELFERFSIQSSGAAAKANARIGSGALYAWIYPNFTLNRYGPCLDSNYIIPLGPNSCRVVYDFFFEDTPGDEAKNFADASADASIAQSDITQKEDIAICESVQVGLQSSSYDQGRYAPTVEMGEYHFHQLLHKDLTQAAQE